jgi:anaerobic selenocysteine-containing dehydrogenase
MWERITWDQALETIAHRLDRLKTEHGAHTLAVYQGRALLQFIRDGWVQRFMDLYGTPNLVRNEHMCAVPNQIGERLTYGQPAVFYSFDPERTNCLILWGSNPKTSHLPTQWADMLRATRRGCKLIVVDPRRTEPAARADIHVQLRYGTDPALALGVIRVILEEELHDASFVARWTHGLDKLCEAVRPFTPERVERITGVPAKTVIEMARMYASNEPAYLDAGNSLEHHSNSRYAVRAVSILRAITGNLDVPGGHLLAPSLPLKDLRLKGRRPDGLSPLGRRTYPILVDTADFVPGDALMKAMEEGDPYPIRAMVMGGGNPLLTWPNTSRLRESLKQLEFLVVADLYMTETAKMADIVLPMADPFERTQLIATSGYFGDDRPPHYVMLRKQIKDPGERRSDWWFWSRLARRMGYESHFPWTNVRDAIDCQLEPLGICVRDLEREDGGLYWGDRPCYRAYEQCGFRTPTGKVELSSTTLAACGFRSTPTYEEPAESPERSGDLARTFPLVLNAGRRVAGYTHSRHRTLPSLRRREPTPRAEIHPTTAAEHGIGDGDWMVVESPRGAIRVRARVTDRMPVGAVSLLHGWEEANANYLTDHAACDPVLACPPLRAGLCRVRRVDGD